MDDSLFPVAGETSRRSAASTLVRVVAVTMEQSSSEESEMVDDAVNAILVLGHELLLVEVGGGAETHLAGTAEDKSGRAAVNVRRPDVVWSQNGPARYEDPALVDPRWEESTLCGRVWQEMAACDDGMLRRWQEVSLAPTCRSCLRVVDTWFPKADAPGGIELLAAIVTEKVEAFGAAHVTGVPAHHVEAVRRSVRKRLRSRGFRSQTHVVSAVVHVFSDDASAAIEPSLRRSWIDQAISRVNSGNMKDEQAPDTARDAVDWNTWVVES